MFELELEDVVMRLCEIESESKGMQIPQSSKVDERFGREMLNRKSERQHRISYEVTFRSEEDARSYETRIRKKRDYVVDALGKMEMELGIPLKVRRIACEEVGGRNVQIEEIRSETEKEGEVGADELEIGTRMPVRRDTDVRAGHRFPNGETCDLDAEENSAAVEGATPSYNCEGPQTGSCKEPKRKERSLTILSEDETFEEFEERKKRYFTRSDWQEAQEKILMFRIGGVN